jgi:hypothetical protein
LTEKHRTSPHRLARRNSLRSLRELRSDNRRESDGRRALRAPPLPLRFSAAHKARHPRPARAFAGIVAVCASACRRRNVPDRCGVRDR